MSKKQSFLKRNPLIPSIFFILFAWGLLYLITGVKGASSTDTSPNQSFSFKFSDDGWQIALSEEKITFRASADAPELHYQQPKVKRIKADEAHAVQVFSAENKQGDILVYLTHFKSSVYQVIIQQGEAHYYYYGKP